MNDNIKRTFPVSASYTFDVHAGKVRRPFPVEGWEKR